MAPFKTDALVVRAEPFRDFDKRVILLTKQFGKVIGIAPAAQRSRKRFGGGLESLNFISVVFQEKSQHALVRFQEIQVINSYPRLKKDIKKLAYASYFLELISEVMHERESLPHLFEYLNSFLRALEKTRYEVLLCRFFEARLLPKIGWQPNISDCSICKQSLEVVGKKIHFSYQEGIIYCDSCAKKGIQLSGTQEVSKETILYVKKMIEGEKNIKPQPELEHQLKFLPLFLFHQLGKELHSYRFIESVVSTQK